MNMEVQPNDEVQSAIPAIMARARREAEKQIEQQCTNALLRAASAEAEKWAAEVLVPEIRAQLELGKQGMLTQAEQISKNLATAIGEALVKNATETLSKGYNVRTLSDALFGY